MTNPANNPWDLGGGGESFPFDNVDDEIEGYVQEMSERQGTDMRTGEPAWWDKEQTRPQMLTILILQTSLRTTPHDDGKRSVTLSGSKKPESRSRMAAALGAVKTATGGSEMAFNAWFKMKFVGEGPRTQVGFNPPKYYEAWYRPPAMDLEGNSHQASPAPASQENQPAQGWAQEQLQGAQQQLGANAQAAGVPITAAQVAGLKAAGVDPALVYGADWANRVVA